MSSESNSKESDYDSEDNKKDCHELILSNTSLRNIFQLGYNSRSLTKNIANSIKFQDVINNIVQYATSDELTVRSYGPLILGLVRIYDKKLKIILEEITMLNKSKSSLNQFQEKKEDKKRHLVSSQKKTELTSNKKHALTNSNNALLAISPMKEGVFSLMNNYSKEASLTPSKQPNYDLVSQDSKEVLRATFAQQSSFSKRLLSSNKKNTENQIQNPELNLSDNNNQPELNNFFDFINDANESFNMNNVNLLISSGDKDKDMSNLYAYSGTKSQLKKVSFKEIENALKEKHKTVPYTHRNAKLEYDEEEIQINLEPDYAFKNEDTITELTKRLKKKLQVSTIKDIDQFNDIKYDYLYPDIDKANGEEPKEKENDDEHQDNIEKEQPKRGKKKQSLLSDDLRKSTSNIQSNLLSNKKRISMDSFDLNSTVLMKNLSRLSLDRKDFSNIMSFNEKLDQIKEIKEISIDNKDHHNQFDLDLNQFNDNNDLALDYNQENNNHNNNINELSAEIQKKILKKKKSILFNDLHSKLSIQYDTKGSLFYNLLCLAQKGELNLQQDGLFDNNSITIAKSN